MALGLVGGTPLHRAFCRRNITAVKALLHLGADPLTVDDNGISALGRAAQFHLVDIFRLLHSYIPNYKANQDHGPNLRLSNFAINSSNPLDLFRVHGAGWRENAKVMTECLLKTTSSAMQLPLHSTI